jgi:hypothetical protein
LTDDDDGEFAARIALEDRLRSDHLNLAEVIEILEAEPDPTRVLPVGFHHPHSWRGDYSELAFEPAENISIGDMLTAARSARGVVYQGWKGGDYPMDPHTPCWLSIRGESRGETLGRWLLRMLLGHPPVPPAPAPEG